MDAKGRKVLNGLTKLGGEQEVFDLSIAIKMTEDAVSEILKKLSEEGLVSCRRDDGGKELWSVSTAQPAASAPSAEPKEPAASGKKKAKTTAAGPDDRFDEFVVDPKAAAAPPPASPAPIPPEPADDFEPKPPKKEKRTRSGDADADFEPKPKKESSTEKSAPGPDADSFEPKSAKESRTERELSAGPDDHFDEFAERVPSKPNLPIPLMAGIAALVLIVILFIVGGGGGKTKLIKKTVEDVKTELTGRLDSLATAIDTLRAENKALGEEVNRLKAELKKVAGQDAKKTAADKPADNKQKKNNKR